MWVKICANTCAEDALRAAELGADAVGFVFAPSVRQVTPEQVRVMGRELPGHVERIGVFGAQPAGEIAAAAERAELTGVQLHGGFDRELTAELSTLLAPGVSIVQTVHWEIDGEDSAPQAVRARLGELAEFEPARSAPGSRVLVDAKVLGASGGTGRPFPWASAAAAFSQYPGLSFVVAGGLRHDNVAEAIRVLKPWGVDVASGVEREPGRKDFEKLRLFLRNARGA